VFPARMSRHECPGTNAKPQHVGINAASGEGAVRRSASRLQRKAFFDRMLFPKFLSAADNLSAKACRPRLRMSPLRRRHRAATFVVAAARIVDRKPRRIHNRAAVARMRSLADTAGMRRLPGGRQRQRDKVPHNREQQQKSGSQAMHASRENPNKKIQTTKCAQHRTNSQTHASQWAWEGHGALEAAVKLRSTRVWKGTSLRDCGKTHTCVQYRGRAALQRRVKPPKSA